MNQTHKWVPEKEAAAFLGLGHSTLRLMRRERKLLPGDHWIFATGKPNGPVHYDITAIRKYLADLTIAATKAEDARRERELAIRKKAIETYSEESLSELIAEVQS